MKTVELTNQKMTGLYAILKALSKSTLPIKFTIARNLKSVEEFYTTYTEKKDALHKAAVMLDDEGDSVVKDEFKEIVQSGRMPSIPYEWFEYQNEEAKESFFKELKELNETTVSIKLAQEDLKRKIKVRLQGEKSESIETLTLEEIIEDPSSNVNADAIAALLEYEILK